MSEWIELKDLQAVAKAQSDGWEIESNVAGEFSRWLGLGWNSQNKYRARPPQSKMKKVKSLCWRDKEFGALMFRMEECAPTEVNWQRFPAGDIEGEVEDD